MERYGHVARSFNRLVDGLASTRCVHSVCVCVCVCDKRSGNDVTGRRNTSCSLRSISSGLKEKKSVARRWSPSRLSVCPRARAIPLPHAALFFSTCVFSLTVQISATVSNVFRILRLSVTRSFNDFQFFKTKNQKKKKIVRNLNKRQSIICIWTAQRVMSR